MVHQFDPQMAPDSDFEPGTLAHLVPGNTGRQLDPRRTPVRIERARPETAMFVLEITGFEDRGARWELPLEDAAHFQFALGSARASAAEVASFEAAVERFSTPLAIAFDGAARTRTLARLAEARREAARWLDRHPLDAAREPFVPNLVSRRGDPRAWAALRAFLAEPLEFDLPRIESTFARTFASNPRSGEIVKGHRIVAAELGLAPFIGTIVRDPDTWAPPFTREARAAHLIRRMGFTHALFERAGFEEVELWRGIALDGIEVAVDRPTFVSTSFVREVAESLFTPAGGTPAGMLQRQRTPIGRLFMTYVETAELNERFEEAEAVVLATDLGVLF